LILSFDYGLGASGPT